MGIKPELVEVKMCAQCVAEWANLAYYAFAKNENSSKSYIEEMYTELQKLKDAVRDYEHENAKSAN